MLDIWLCRARDAAADLLDYMEEHWYGGQTGSSITLHPSSPDSNPFARGYAQASRVRLTSKDIDVFPEPAAWTQQRAA